MTLQGKPDIFASLSHVVADMNYFAPMTERPRNYTFDPPSGVPRSNAQHVTHAVAIHGARPVADNVTLDANGFARVRHRSVVKDS